MNYTGFTPGPWHLRPWFDGKACVVTVDDAGVAKLVIAKVEDSCESFDARLIAAAPKTLEALSALTAAAEMCPGRSCGEDEWYRWINLIQRALKQSHAAMKQAGMK